MDLAQKKGVHMLSLSENGATAWKAAKMAREVKNKFVRDSKYKVGKGWNSRVNKITEDPS
jgi:hypothetical protein